MANWGNTSTPGSGYFFDHSGNSQFWSNVGSFPGGTITDLYVYCAGDGATASGQLVIWGFSALLWQSGALTLPSGSQSIGGQGWVHVSVPSVYIAPQTLDLGFWSSGNVVWTYEGSGNLNYQRGVSGGPSSLTFGGNEGGGALGAYVTYTPIAAPTVTSATPNVGVAGTSVVVAGSSFTSATGVTINGVAAAFTINSDLQITCTVPAGAAPGTGTLVVTNPSGSASVPFTVGTVLGDDGANWQGGVLVSADDGSTWQSGVTVWADNGTNWVQIG